MRRFSSYGPVNTHINYYAPREELIDRAYIQLMGENPTEGGHYITVWAPRQTGKTWTMQQILFRLQQDSRFDVLKINLEHLKYETDAGLIINDIAGEIGDRLHKPFSAVNSQAQFQEIFKTPALDKPLILIMDEFDALCETAINSIVGAFRNIYTSRMDELAKPTEKKTYLLHGVALIGVRSVLGIENQKGSPFNIQRSVHIPNLTYDEVKGMFEWYEKESGQPVEEDVIRVLYREMLGQPGLTCWFGELLTETYNRDSTKPIAMSHFEEAYGAATHILPNNNILDIISKVKKSPYREWVLELFKTREKIYFKFDNEHLNYLYMHGVIAAEKIDPQDYFVKFSCPFVQSRLFDYFSGSIFDDLGLLVHPLDEMDDAIDKDRLHIPNIIKRYKAYLEKNRTAVFNGVPRRKKDLKIYEAIYHFNIYRYLFDLLSKRGVDVIPEFPTGNGKIDLILKYREKIYALELKSFRDMYDYREGIEQAAQYGRELGLKEIVYLVFVELKEEEVKKLAQEIERPGIKVISIPVGVA